MEVSEALQTLTDQRIRVQPDIERNTLRCTPATSVPAEIRAFLASHQEEAVLYVRLTNGMNKLQEAEEQGRMNTSGYREAQNRFEGLLFEYEQIAERVTA